MDNPIQLAERIAVTALHIKLTNTEISKQLEITSNWL